jgi:hypothetical protein
LGCAEEVSALLTQAEVQERLRVLSFVALPANPDAFRRLIIEGHDHWGPALRQAGLKLD